MPQLHIHNTLSRQKEAFTPIDPANVRMYVCGPTVYDFAHLGNARPVVVFDTLFRLLQRHYPRVTYARNITDVDDKIMAKARETGEPIDAITTRTTQAFHDDMAALNALSPTIEPRCTQHIGQMIVMNQRLIDTGHAYVAEGHVLFNVPSMADYGQLSRRSRDELIAGARVDVAPYKKDAADFVLWKPSTPEQSGWDSPWGRGRPGWHIECSAMAKEHLGDTFDIHGGGLDLIFPHHENEIAQSRCAHDGAPLAHYWMHNGFLTINSDKMSKSLNNFFTVRDLLAQAPGEALRLALLSGHYRQPLDFSVESLQAAKTTLDKWYGALRMDAGETTIKSERSSPLPLAGRDREGGHPLSAMLNSEASHQMSPPPPLTPPRKGTGNDTGFVPTSVPETIESALLDDLNTPLAISHIHELANALNRAVSPEDKARLKDELINAGQALGLLQQDAAAWFRWQPQGETGLDPAYIDQRIMARLAARKAKDFAESDRIRDELAAKGIILEDNAQGTSWKRK